MKLPKIEIFPTQPQATLKSLDQPMMTMGKWWWLTLAVVVAQAGRINMQCKGNYTMRPPTPNPQRKQQ